MEKCAVTIRAGGKKMDAKMQALNDPYPVKSCSRKHYAFIVPLLLLHLCCALIVVVGVSKAALVVFALATFLRCFGITAGFHRLLAHKAYKTSRTFQFVICMFGTLAGQNGPLWWVGHHRHHHRFADTARDLHSPRQGLLWSHVGWLFSPACVEVRSALVPDLRRLAELQFLEKHYYAVHLLFALLLVGLGEACATWRPQWGTDGFQLLVWGSVVSMVCSYHMIWSANSLGHKFGRRRFNTRDNSRNNFLVALLTLGDGWHNNHHYLPGSARHGFLWWELDLNYLILKLLAHLGLVWDLKEPPRPLCESR